MSTFVLPLWNTGAGPNRRHDEAHLQALGTKPTYTALRIYTRGAQTVFLPIHGCSSRRRRINLGTRCSCGERNLNAATSGKKYSLGPLHADLAERRGERRVDVDLGVGNHHADDDAHDDVEDGADAGRANDADGHVLGRVARLDVHAQGDSIEGKPSLFCSYYSTVAPCLCLS